MSNEVSGSSTTNDGSTAGGSSADGRVASPTRMSLNAPTSGTSHTDPNMGTTSSVCEPDASTSVASDLVDLERRKLPFPPMRQVVDPDKQMKLRAHTGLNSGGGSSRHGGSSVGRGSRSQKSTSTGGGVKPYRAPLSVSVGGVNLGTITSVAGPLTLDATTGQPTIVVGVRAPTPTTAGTPLSWQLTQPFDADASESLPPPPSNRIDTQQPQPTATFPRVTSPVATPASPNQSAAAPVASRAVATPARTPGTKKPAKPTPTSSLTGAALATQQEPASSAVNVASPDKGSVLSGASNSSPMKPLRLGSTVGSDDEREHHEARLRYSESQASIELLAQQAQQLLDREEAATVDRNPSSGDLDSQTSDFSTGSPHLFATQWSSALDDEVMKMLTMDLVPSFAELHERHTMVKRVIECYKLALQHVIPGRFDVKFCIVGSVQSRTCLPDGDNDVAVFVYPHPDCPYNAPLADALRGNIHVLGADLMARARDHMIGFPGINVESLVFAEVRLLKLVVDGMNVDLTAGQIGGYTASAFVSEVDKFIGYEHRFRYALMLVKAWCLHDARVIGGAGGYLSTYAIATILIAVFNQLYRDGPPPQRELQPLRILLHFLRYCAEFDFEHQVLTMYGPVRLENVQRFIDELPRQQERDGANPRAKVGWSLVDRCLRKYSGYLPPDQSTHGTPTPPHAFSPSPSGTSTPPSMMGSSPQFPLRPMNIMDPLKPLNNLTRGVNLSHMHRISGAFRRGYDVLSRLVERHSNEPMRVIEVFFKGVLDALEQYPSSDRSVPENAVKCKRCSRSTVFCTDMDYMERMGYDVTSPPISVTSNTVFGYEVARRMPPQAHASPTGAMPTYPVHHHHHHHHLQHHSQHHHHHHHHHHHSYPPQQHQPQQSMHRGNGSYMNIPPGHHAMPHYVQHQQRHHTPHGAMQQPPLGHTSSMGQHQHLPPAVLSTSKSARQSPSGPVGSHPMPSQPSPNNSPSAGWQQQHQMQQQPSPSTSAQGVANAGSSGFRGAPGASTYGAGLRTEREPRGGGFTTHATHRTPRDFDVNRRNSGSAANIAAAASHPPSPPLLDMTTSPSLPPATNGLPLPQPAAGQRYLPPHTRKPDQPTAGDAGSAPPHNHERRR